MSGRARIRACASFASCSAAETQSTSQAGQIIAVPWVFTHSAHQPLPHREQMPSDGTDVWVAQRRQALAAERAGRGDAAGRAAVAVRPAVRAAGAGPAAAVGRGAGAAA